MIKNLISPIQRWLLTSGQCVGCGTPLKFGSTSPAKIKDSTKVTCHCGRVFIYNPYTKEYRRALLSEI